MKITYDKAVDAMYIKLNEKASYKESKKVSEDVIIDYSQDGLIIGLEILAASKNALLPGSVTSIPVEQKSPA